MIIFSDNREKLSAARKVIQEKLQNIRLYINEKMDYIHSNKEGVDFLGFRLYNNRIMLRNANLVRLKRKLKATSKQPVQDFRQFLQSINGHLGFLKGGHT